MIGSRTSKGLVVALGATVAVLNDMFEVLATPEVLAAVASVVWRVEDFVAVPEWVRLAVFVALVIVALQAIYTSARRRG